MNQNDMYQRIPYHKFIQITI